MVRTHDHHRTRAPRVCYVTDGWGVHDERWLNALRSCGLEPECFRLSRAGTTSPPGSTLAGGSRSSATASPAEELPHADIVDRLGSATGILAGPLPHVARPLVEAGLTQVVGLSWGWDLQVAHRTAVADADLAWLSRLRHLIVDSEATAARARRLGMPPERTALIPWGVDLDVFTPDGPRATLDLADSTRVLLTLRAHEQTYRTDDVLRAFAEADMPDAVLIVGGQGSMTGAYHDWVADHGLAERVRFIGRIAESALPTILRRADAYVSASETDGTSVTLLQAMATGTPVIASLIPGNAAWLDGDRAGRSFPVGDISELAQAMREVHRRTPRPDAGSLRRTESAMALVRERADWRRNRAIVGDLVLGRTTPA